MDREIINLDDIEEKVTHERYNRPTPNGGDYSEIFYMDDNGNYVDKKVATKAVMNVKMMVQLLTELLWRKENDRNSGKCSCKRKCYIKRHSNKPIWKVLSVAYRVEWKNEPYCNNWTNRSCN